LYFTPGDLGYLNFDTPFGRIGTLICWDQWYPEGARLSSLGGAHILFYPTAIGWHPSEKAQYGAAQLDAWKTIQRSHAIANGIYVAAANRVGYEGPPGQGIEFWGTSFATPRETKKSASTGLFCGTAVSIRTPRLCSDVSANSADNTAEARLSHAGRVGAAPCHMGCVAA
jgi:predicted amidohydrolase